MPNLQFDIRNCLFDGIFAVLSRLTLEWRNHLVQLKNIKVKLKDKFLKVLIMKIHQVGADVFTLLSGLDTDHIKLYLIVRSSL